MRKLLNTLYITNPNVYLSNDLENIVVSSDGKEIGRFPFHNIDSIVTVGYRGASPKLMANCAEHNISLVFLSANGKFLGKYIGPLYGNVILRKQQYNYSEDQSLCVSYAKSFIIAKIYNSKWVLQRAVRDYPLRVDIDKLKSVSSLMDVSIKELLNDIDNIDSLRGIEGKTAVQYFGAFNELILQQKEDFKFVSRSRRPPKDELNAMLSFAYALLESMCTSALEAVGLDPYVGFMHTIRPGRHSLSLDLMEELRSVLADRFVITLINKKIITKKDFQKEEDGAVILNDNGRKTFITEWQKRKLEIITHPFLAEKVEWGIVPYVQALLLARTIRGDIDVYPPFLWK